MMRSITAILNPFCWLALVIAPHLAVAGTNTGDISGTAFTVESDGERSVIPGAAVRLVAPSSSMQTVTDERGNYSFVAVAPGSYLIEAKAPGFIGLNSVTVATATTLDVP